jgi:CO dehydrogenase maturation factor
VETAHQVRRLAADIGIQNLAFVGNKIRSERDEGFLEENMPGFRFLGFIPYDASIVEADLDGRPPFEKNPKGLEVVRKMLREIEGGANTPGP